MVLEKYLGSEKENLIAPQRAPDPVCLSTLHDSHELFFHFFVDPFKFAFQLYNLLYVPVIMSVCGKLFYLDDPPCPQV